MPKLIDSIPFLYSTIINKERHVDYDHVEDVAEDFTAFATGNGIDEMLKRFNQRETEDAFEQRKKLTIVNTTDIVSRLRKPLAKVNRTPASVSISWKGADSASVIEKKNRLIETSNNFWGNKSVEKYLSQRLSELDTIDPNSFLVIEFKGVVDPKKPESSVSPYPFEVNSKEAVNYLYLNNILQWLIVLNSGVMIDGKGASVSSEVYYMYLENENVKATEFHPDLLDNFKTEYNAEVITKDFTDIQISKKYILTTAKAVSDNNARFFLIEVFEHKIGHIPAKRIGTTLDPLTRFRTCVPVINPAKCYLEKSVQAMSEMDLTMILHAFPQKIVYEDPCDGTRGSEGQMIGCQKGLTPSGAKCKSCGGTGFKEHSSAQDVMRIRMPRDISEIVSLENILVYKYPPIDLLKFQKEYAFDVLINESISSVYNSQIFSRKDIAQTATENNIDLDSVYDTLRDFADNSSEFYVFCMKTIASIKDLDKDIIITHSYPSDFKMQPLNSLLDELEKANKNGAPSHVKYAINKKIVNKIYSDQPASILKIETKDKFFPYQGKSESEINMILTSDISTRFDRVLYANFDKIFNDLEFESSIKELDFYQLDESLQRALITAKVSQIITEIEKDASGDVNLSLDENQKPLPGDIEAESKAKLKGSVSGVQGIIEIQTAFANGITTKESALSMLSEIYGFPEDIALKMLGAPKLKVVQPAA